MRYKTVPCKIKGRVDDDEPLVSKSLETESRGVVANVAGLLGIFFIGIIANDLG